MENSNLSPKKLEQTFQNLVFDTEEDEYVPEVIEEKINIFYLFSSKQETYELYKILKNFHIITLSEVFRDIRIDSTILISLIEEFGLSKRQALTDIPFIHAGYVSEILEYWNSKNGN